MLHLENCKICGTLFTSNGMFDICPYCKKQDDEVFERIREYLEQYPNSNILEVALNLDISVRRIKRYLRECRLQIVEKDNTFLLCKKCGQSIQSGEYCDSCIDNLYHDYKVAYKGRIVPVKEKFHYLPFINR
ncbi:MAG: flagellar protein [Clostridiaceae bacterium]|nr:flagellar protein [Clostridiaceae bacterium]